MTTPTGTPDWSMPLPGGARLLVDDGFNLQNLGGNYVSAWFDVTSFSGLFVQTNGFDLVGDFGSLEVQFKDAQGGQVIEPKYDATWRGDLPLAVNVPVLGAQARVVIQGPAHNVNATLCVTGHGGGPSAAVGSNSRVLAVANPVALGVGVIFESTVPIIREGAAILYLNTGTQPGVAFIQVVDSVGAGTTIAGLRLPANSNDVRRVWIPPQPIFLNVENEGAAASDYVSTLTLERG